MRCGQCGYDLGDNEGLSFCPKCNNYLKDDNVNSTQNVNNNVTFDSIFQTQSQQSNNTFVQQPLNQSVASTPGKFIQTQNVNNQQVVQQPINQNNGFSTQVVQPINSTPQYNSVTPPVNNNVVNIEKNKKGSGAPVFLVLALWALAIGLAVFLLGDKKEEYHFEDGKDNGIINEQIEQVEDDNGVVLTGISKSGQQSVVGSQGITSIIFDKQYLKQTILNSQDDVYKIIVSDSVSQKSNCSQEIINIENEIINNYNIKAVNMCEMSPEFARELRDVVAYIYNKYPSSRGHMTNLTLANVPNGATYMAAFMPIFTFATSNTSNSYPIGVKTQIILNAKYFLNEAKINQSASYGSRSGYFPPGATKSSTVAHEFGHYLSYIAMLNYHKASSGFAYVKATNSNNLYTVYNDFNDGNYSYTMLQEAYNLYLGSYNGNGSFDDFRGSISHYALSKDSSGNYIYDETIAEAFHDCYLNGSNAKPASKAIVNVLEKYL